jgi:hypothetical protein
LVTAFVKALPFGEERYTLTQALTRMPGDGKAELRNTT